MSDKRNREIRELMAETGMCYTRAAREVARRRQAGRTLKDAFPDQMAQLRLPFSEALQGQIAQLHTPAIKGLQEQIAQLHTPAIKGLQEQIAQLHTPAIKGLQEQIAQLHTPAIKGLQEQIAQLHTPAIKGLQEQIAQLRLPVSTAFQDQMALLAEQLATNAQQVRRNLASAGGVGEIERRYKAVRWFRALGHSIDDRPSELDDAETGRPRWRCQRCGSDLQLDGSAGWASSTGTGRCPHEGASW